MNNPIPFRHKGEHSSLPPTGRSGAGQETDFGGKLPWNEFIKKPPPMPSHEAKRIEKGGNRIRFQSSRASKMKFFGSKEEEEKRGAQNITSPIAALAGLTIENSPVRKRRPTNYGEQGDNVRYLLQLIMALGNSTGAWIKKQAKVARQVLTKTVNWLKKLGSRILLKNLNVGVTKGDQVVVSTTVAKFKGSAFAHTAETGSADGSPTIEEHVTEENKKETEGGEVDAIEISSSASAFIDFYGKRAIETPDVKKFNLDESQQSAEIYDKYDLAVKIVKDHFKSKMRRLTVLEHIKQTQRKIEKVKTFLRMVIQRRRYRNAKKRVRDLKKEIKKKMKTRNLEEIPEESKMYEESVMEMPTPFHAPMAKMLVGLIEDAWLRAKSRKDARKMRELLKKIPAPCRTSYFKFMQLKSDTSALKFQVDSWVKKK